MTFEEVLRSNSLNALRKIGKCISQRSSQNAVRAAFADGYPTSSQGAAAKKEETLVDEVSEICGRFRLREGMAGAVVIVQW